MDVSVDDAVGLTQALVRISSANPSPGSVPGPGEAEVVRYIAAWLEHRDIETHWVEPVSGRPSVVGIVRGSGGGKSLMLNGHIDTVTTLGYDGRLYGRGAADNKAGVAAALVALARAKTQKLRGDVVFAVAGETPGSVRQEMQRILDTLSKTVEGFKYDLRVTFDRPSFVIEPDHPFAALVGDLVSQSLGSKADFLHETLWTDCALLAAKGIPVLLWGPRGDGLHGKGEWADVASIERVAKALGLLASKVCA